MFDERSRVLYVVAQIPDPYNQQGKKWPTPLRIGTFVQASISGHTAENIIKLPRSVLQSDNSVWTVGSNSELKLRSIKLLRTDKHSIYVTDGLNADDLICITALENPLPGTLVRHGEPIQLALKTPADAYN